MKARMTGIQRRLAKDSTRDSDTKRDYKPRLCNVVIDQGRLGKSRTQIAVYLGISRRRLKTWIDKYPDFAEAMEIALDNARAWWENKAQRSLDKKHFQAGVMGKMMAARFPDEYGDKVTVAGDDDAPIRVIRRVIVDPRRDDSDDKR